MVHELVQGYVIDVIPAFDEARRRMMHSCSSSLQIAVSETDLQQSRQAIPQIYKTMLRIMFQRI
jgi:hypothetical protein